MLHESGLLTDLSCVAFYNGEPLCLYRDPAYSLGVHLPETIQRQQFNTTNGTLQQIHEWGQSGSGIVVWEHYKLF